MTPPTVQLRQASPSDLPAIQAIYAHHVETGLASFEEIPPDLAEMTRRFEALKTAGYPYIVALRGEEIAGYAYAGPYRTRPAYRYSVENSIYIRPDCHRLGIGRKLLEELILQCEARGYRQMVAVIGDSANNGSIGVHRACGFHLIGNMPSIGFKFGRWVDSVLMQRALGEGDRSPPK